MIKLSATIQDALKSNTAKNVAIAGVTLFGVYQAIKYYRRYSDKKKREKYPPDVVILHQFPRGLNAP